MVEAEKKGIIAKNIIQEVEKKLSENETKPIKTEEKPDLTKAIKNDVADLDKAALELKLKELENKLQEALKPKPKPKKTKTKVQKIDQESSSPSPSPPNQKKLDLSAQIPKEDHGDHTGHDHKVCVECGRSSGKHFIRSFDRYCTENGCGEPNPYFKDETICPSCKKHLGSVESVKNLSSCPDCGYKGKVDRIK